MKPQQLTLEFSFNSDKDLEIVDPNASAFLRWTGNNLPGAKVKRMTKPFTAEDKLIEIDVAQRKRSYHTTYDANYFTQVFQPFFAYFETKTAQYATTKTTTVGVGRAATRRPIQAVSYNSIWHPGKVTMNVEDDKATMDIGWAIYHRDDRNSGTISGLPYARLWVHVEYKKTKKGLSSVDKAKSYIGFTHNTQHAGVFVAKFEQIANINTAYGILMPWSTILKLNSQVPKYVVDSRIQIAATMGDSIVLSGIGPGLQKILLEAINGSRGYYRGNGSAHEKLLALGMSGSEAIDYVSFLSSAVVKTKAANKFPKMYSKHVLETASLFLNDGPVEKRSTDDYVRSESLDQWIARVRSVYEALWALMEYYETPNVLNIYEAKEIYEGSYLNARGGYYGARTQPDNLIALAKNKWFSEFPLPKQWRLLKEGLYSAGGNTLGDTVAMLTKIEANEVDLDEHVARRDIKTIKDLHDELVKVYNTIRYKPVPIKPEFTEWITEYGTKVGEEYEFVFPEDTNTIRNWGQIQGHCIGSYADRASTGHTILVGVMDLKTNDWLGHMQIQPANLKKHSISRDRLDDNTNQRASYGQHSICPAAGISVQQFYGKRNSGIPSDKKTPVINHLKEAAIAYFFKPEDKEEN